MGCGNAKSEKKQHDVTINNVNSKIMDQSLKMKSQDLGTSNVINATEIPEGIDVKKYGGVFRKFSGLMELIGDTSTLPPRTLQFLSKLNEAKDRIDKTLEAVEDRSEDYKKKYIYQMFVKFQPPLCDIIAILLNDKPFNQSFPILRETYKEIYHQMKDYQTELQKKRESAVNEQFYSLTVKKADSQIVVDLQIKPLQNVKKETSIANDISQVNNNNKSEITKLKN